MNKKYISGQFVSKTDIGRVRLTNEDNALACINARGNVLLLICDGMGGSNKGELASSLALNSIQDAFINQRKFFNRAHAIYWMKREIRRANNLIYDEAQKNPSYVGMGTTLTAILIVGGFYISAQVGDSRAYILKNNTLQQITEDQTVVAYLFRTGQISESEMATHPKRHVLLNALGNEPTIEVDFKFANYDNETFLVCSDGLYNNLDHKVIESVIKSNEPVSTKCDQLIALANANGGSDNIGIAIWEADK